MAVLASLAVACGGAAAPSKSTEAEPLPADVEGTLQVLDRAENDLARAFQEEGRAAEEQIVEAEKPKEDAHGGTELSGGEKKADSCGPACKALHSMRRAVEHLCGLTGETDTRCDTARGRVARAEERVRATCSSC